MGLKLGAAQELDLNLSAGLYGALKVFVGTRTPFIISIGYDVLTPIIATPTTAPFSRISHQVDMSVGFSYYFDFY